MQTKVTIQIVYRLKRKKWIIQGENIVSIFGNLQTSGDSFYFIRYTYWLIDKMNEKG